MDRTHAAFSKAETHLGYEAARSASLLQRKPPVNTVRDEASPLKTMVFPLITLMLATILVHPALLTLSS